MSPSLTQALWKAAFLVVGLIGCIVGCKEPSLGRNLAGSAKIDEGAVLSAIAGYRDWHKINKVRFPVKNSAAARCVQSSAASGADPHAVAPSPKNPNDMSYMNVFVSDGGVIPLEKLQAESRSITFPFGTVFVKERYSAPEQDLPDVLTVMVKRGFEYNSDAGNWEFAVVSGDGLKVLEFGRLKNCASCHAQSKAHDYVKGGYQ